MNHMDWEDLNKWGFITLVQTLVLKDASISGERANRILFEAMRITKASIPADILNAASELVNVYAHNSPIPGWLNNAKRPVGVGAF